MMVLNTCIFIFIFYKMLFYFQVNREFGLLSELIWGIKSKMTPFISFLFLQLLGFTVMFLILGTNFGEMDMVNSEYYLFFQVF